MKKNYLNKKRLSIFKYSKILIYFFLIFILVLYFFLNISKTQKFLIDFVEDFSKKYQFQII